MRFVLVLVAACGSAPPPPTTTVLAPADATAPAPACLGDACSATLEGGPRFEQPGGDEQGPPPTQEVDAETATCATVGAAYASAKLGNYAEPGELAPLASASAARCEQLALAQPVRTCIAQQTDLASIAYCEPRLVEDVGTILFAESGCDAAIAAVDQRVANRTPLDYERRWWTPAKRSAFLASCKKDRWTTVFAECVKVQVPAYCTHNTPAPLRAVLTALVNELTVAEQKATTDYWNAYAEPKKYPKVRLGILTAGQCSTTLRAAKKRLDTQPPNSWERTWLVPRESLLLASCKKDRWTPDVALCLRSQSANSCISYAPPALQAKLSPIFYNQPPPVPQPPRRPISKR